MIRVRDIFFPREDEDLHPLLFFLNIVPELKATIQKPRAVYKKWPNWSDPKLMFNNLQLLLDRAMDIIISYPTST